MNLKIKLIIYIYKLKNKKIKFNNQKWNTFKR